MTAGVIDSSRKSAEDQRRDKSLVSEREKQIIQLVVRDFSNREIGEKLFIGEQTVKNYLHNIFDKLGVWGRLELALYAIHHQLADPDRLFNPLSQGHRSRCAMASWTR